MVILNSVMACAKMPMHSPKLPVSLICVSLILIRKDKIDNALVTNSHALALHWPKFQESVSSLFQYFALFSRVQWTSRSFAWHGTIYYDSERSQGAYILFKREYPFRLALLEVWQSHFPFCWKMELKFRQTLESNISRWNDPTFFLCCSCLLFLCIIVPLCKGCGVHITRNMLPNGHSVNLHIFSTLS